MMSTKTKNMERRNIQISGGSTYVISLPKKWIEKSFLLNNLIERQKAKAIKNGSK